MWQALVQFVFLDMYTILLTARSSFDRAEKRFKSWCWKQQCGGCWGDTDSRAEETSLHWKEAGQKQASAHCQRVLNVVAKTTVVTHRALLPPI